MTEMHWDCKKRNACFLIKKHPKWGRFDHCFPGKTCITNLDGVLHEGEIQDDLAACELSEKSISSKLILEWKPSCKDLSEGQRRLLQSFVQTQDDLALVIDGDSETMAVRHVMRFTLARGWAPWEIFSFDNLCELFTYWARFASPSRTLARNG